MQTEYASQMELVRLKNREVLAAWHVTGIELCTCKKHKVKFGAYEQ